MQTRKNLLGSMSAVVAGLTVTADSSGANEVGSPLERRFGRTTPPRLSVSLPQDWFLTEELTNVSDPIQLLAISNRVIPAPHANIHGVANPRLIPLDAVLVTGHAFVLTPEMEVYGHRTNVPPPRLRLADMPGTPFGDMGLTTHAWHHTGVEFGIDFFVWIGVTAPANDVQTLDDVMGSLTFDQAL